MVYTVVPTITTGDVATAAWGNQYIKDNFEVGVPDLFTTDGDMAVGTGANAAERVAVMNASNLIKHEVGGLESNISSGDGLVQVKAGATTVIKSNIAASGNPGTGDDTGDGYAIGSFWLNTTADRPYVCLDASSGAAVWKEMSGITNIVDDTSPQLGGNLDMQARLLVGNGGSTGIAISADGEVNMAAQPCVLAYNSGTNSNVTGAGSLHTQEFDTEVFDQGSDFNNSTDTFTADVAGRYLFAVAGTVLGITGSCTDIDYQLIGGNRNVRLDRMVVATPVFATKHMTGTVILDMDDGDAVTVRIQNTGEGSDVHDIQGSSAAFGYISVLLIA